ncbi:MAG: EpsG family protein [bacterium]|nr:EpsG family protein [bacterium]
MRRRDVSWLLVVVTAVFVIVLCWQYPLSVSFPVGGDVMRYIARANAVKDALQFSIPDGFSLLIRNSSYPASILVVLVAGLVPIGWPEKWLLLMFLAQIACAGSLYYVVGKITGNRITACLAAAAWAIVGLSFTRHIEDGTFAQLMSLPAFVFFLGQLMNKKYITAIFWVMLSFLFHPVTGLVAGLVAVLYLVTNLDNFVSSSKKKVVGLVLLVISLGVAIYFLKKYDHLFLLDYSSDNGISLTDLLNSSFGTLLVMTPLGMIVFLRKYKREGQALVVATFILFLFIFQNQLVGESMFINRINSYPAIFVSIFSAIAIAEVVRTIRVANILLRVLLVLVFFSMGVSVWSQQGNIYRYYDDPGNYARVHPDELAAIYWLRDNTAADDGIVSTVANRHSEWIPILSQRQWVGLYADDVLFTADNFLFKKISGEKGYDYAVVFKNREERVDLIKGGVSESSIVYQNDAAEIIKISQL